MLDNDALRKPQCGAVDMTGAEIQSIVDELVWDEIVAQDFDTGEPMTSEELSALDAAISSKEAETRLSDELAIIAENYITGQAKKKSQGNARVTKHRANLTPAKEAEERAKARERMRKNRAIAKGAQAKQSLDAESRP